MPDIIYGVTKINRQDIEMITEKDIRDRILEKFNRERQAPNTYFNESHFLDFLSSPPHSKNTIKNTFKGARRYYRFMDCLELEFGICFPLSDLDKYYSVDALTKKVQERINKGRGNLIILKQRNKEKERYWIEIVLIVILVAAYYWFGVHWISILLTILLGMAIWWLLSSKIYNRQHNRKLSSIIIKEK